MSNIFVTHRKLTDKIMLQALNLFHELFCDRTNLCLSPSRTLCHWFRRHPWWRHTMLGLPPWAPEFFAFRSLHFSVHRDRFPDHPQSHKVNVMEFYVTLPDSFHIKWPRVALFDLTSDQMVVRSLSRSKNRSVIGNLTLGHSLYATDCL